MRKNIVLIDFESVQPDSIEALNQEHFQVLLFCGANQTKIPFEIVANLQNFGARAHYIKIAGTGPNALDFHIAYYIGKLSAEDPSVFFHIISRDKGFDPLIIHLKAQKILSARSESISEIPIVKNGAKKSLSRQRADELIAKLKEPKVTKPRTEKSMSSAIKAFFRSDIEELDVPKILKSMVATGFISIAEGKIVYTQSAAAPYPAAGTKAGQEQG